MLECWVVEGSRSAVTRGRERELRDYQGHRARATAHRRARRSNGHQRPFAPTPRSQDTQDSQPGIESKPSNPNPNPNPPRRILLHPSHVGLQCCPLCSRQLSYACICLLLVFLHGVRRDDGRPTSDEARGPAPRAPRARVCASAKPHRRRVPAAARGRLGGVRLQASGWCRGTYAAQRRAWPIGQHNKACHIPGEASPRPGPGARSGATVIQPAHHPIPVCASCFTWRIDPPSRPDTLCTLPPCSLCALRSAGLFQHCVSLSVRSHKRGRGRRLPAPWPEPDEHARYADRHARSVAVSEESSSATAAWGRCTRQSAACRPL